MQGTLSTTVARLSDLGWELNTQTETTASLTTRAPFRWLWFAFWFVLFLGFGALLYTVWWLMTSRKHVFAVVDGGEVRLHGDTHYLQLQEARAEAVQRARREISEKGFLKAVFPSILAFIATVALWFLIVWALLEIF